MTAKELSSTLQRHKEWIANPRGNGKRADLRGAELRHVNFEGSDLRWVDFRGADLSQAVLTKADCRHADFRGANMTKSVCVGADFTNARLEGANLLGVDLRFAVMDYAQMKAVNLTTAYDKVLGDYAKGAAAKSQEKHREKAIER
jgi:uncharacterized protein YjbI with pentapeptide repeats